MVSMADLAKNRINILSVQQSSGAGHIVALEYRYSPADGTPATWHRCVVFTTDKRPIYDQVLDEVRLAKAQLEA